MIGNPQRYEQLFEFLKIVRDSRFVCVRDLSSEEIEMAEELVNMKLLTKISTNLTTIYTYGATENGGHSE